MKILEPSFLRSEIERLFDAISTCRNVPVKIIQIPFDGQAGGDVFIPGCNHDPVTITTIPQASWQWQEVIALFRDPWIKFKPIRDYVTKNKLWDKISEDDDVITDEIYQQFRDKLINYAYNKIWTVYSRYYTEQTAADTSKPSTAVKPLHKNKAFTGGIVITLASLILKAANVILPPDVTLAIAGIIAAILAAVEHKSYQDVFNELKR